MKELKENYNDEDLLNKNYAILYWDAEEPYEYIVSLHDEYDKAKKRLDYLNKQANKLFDKGIATCRYGIYKTDDLRLKKCFNYERDEQ